MKRKILLGCGIVSTIVYIGATFLGARQWTNYDWTSLSISELFALDAPSRTLVASAFVVYGPLVVAFGVGVWMSAGTRRALRAAGATLVGYGLSGLPGPIFFALPTMQRGAQATTSDATQVTLHLTLTLLLVLFLLAAIGFGASTFGPRFRVYSITTFAAVVIFGGLAGAQAQAISANAPTPWLGVEERINVFGAMLWIAALATGLLRVSLPASSMAETRAVRTGSTALPSKA